MEADQPTHHGEAQASAFIGAVMRRASLEKGFAKVGEIVRGDADAAVGDRKIEGIALGPDRTVTLPSGA